MISPTKINHDTIVGANSRLVRNINRAIILNCIRESQPISRAEIARLSRLNKSTVSSIVRGLLDEDLLAENVERNAAVGRNPISLRLKKGRNFFGAVSFDAAATRVAIIDVDGTIHATEKIRTEGGPAERFISLIFDRLAGLRGAQRLPRLKGIGVSVAGIVDPARGKVLFAPNLGWENVSVGDLLASAFPDAGVTAIENDAKSAALAELWFGRHRGALSNFVFLSVGRGIGAGIVIDRRILPGDSYHAGEFGHMILIEGGEHCSCGNDGCWEAYASDGATVRRYAAAQMLDAAAARAVTIDDVLAAARHNDQDAIRALRTSGRFLGIGIANVVKAVNPGVIIVGGHVTRVWDLIAPDVLGAARKASFFGERAATAILPTSLTRRPSLLGAAALAMQKSFGEARVTF
ncbi:MAG TPA: ROK family transcriptional regulator [Bacteroidota bacterium]